ncbi:MAG: carboxypeptidase regulatory-like domain-containing protein [Candidatus Nomurabacteria bacterium]|nr:carboxypeptidase regulatory-like domain-containing protein [Candidatus Nomurabacteria bacterium]
MNSKSNRKNGFTLIETMIGVAVFAIVVLACYQVFDTLMTAVISSKAKVTATALANEEFEIIRNLPYSNVGVVAGIPVGKIPRTQTLTRNGFAFNVQTTIRSIDDPFDGTFGGSPNDTSPADYKLADLDITCPRCKSFNPLGFTTLIAPRTLETLTTNGVLNMQVIDASGVSIPGAAIHIVNTHTSPTTTIDETTDNTGWFKIVDAPTGTNVYNITATKAGYSQDQTYPIGGVAGATPVKPDSTVTAGQTTQLSFAIDRLSTLNVSTVNASCVATPSIGFSLTGAKLIGTPSVLKYTAHTFTTDTNGILSVPSLEWDTYSTLLTSASYDLAGASLLPTFSLSPNTTASLQLIAVPHVNMALLVSVKDANNIPIDGATVTLTKTGFNQTKTTNSGACATPGQTFWNGLASGTYTLTVSKIGYQTNTNSALSISTAWKNQIVTLTP